MGRYLSLALGALILAAVLVAIQLRRGDGTSKHAATTVGPSSPFTQEPTTTGIASDATAPTKADFKEPSSPHREESDPAFRRWISDEAKNLDAPSVNAERKRKEIKEIVQKLTPTQSRQLLATARDPRAPAAEKILSTYLLVEGGPLSRSELTALITSPLEDHGPHQAHSEAEMAGVRDKSLRIMALDGLFSRAQNDPSAREALAKVISDIQDPYVREYARERYSRLR